MSYQFDRQQKPFQSMLNAPQRARSRLQPTATGQSLDPLTRQEMEARFNHDFSDVQVHSNGQASQAAQTMGTRAYTVGSHIVFGPGQYAPHTPEGKQLLAHEMAHVVQTSTSTQESGHSYPEREARDAAQQVAQGENVTIQSSVPASSLHREDGNDDENRRFRLQMPQLGQSLTPRPSSLSLVDQEQFQLHLDPQIQAQIAAMRFVREQLSSESLDRAVSQMGQTTPTAQQTAAAPDLSPRAAALAAQPTTPRPDPFSVPASPTQQPLVPAGAGPATPRAGSVGDILQATLRIPAVRAGVDRLREQASQRVQQDWSRLSTGERALVVTQGIVMSAGALTGIALSPEARQFALDQIQGRDIPIPGVPVTFRFNLTGPNQQLMIGVNVGQLLPPSLGFQ